MVRERATLRHQLRGTKVQVELTRRFAALPPPAEGSAVAYTTENTVRIRRGAAGQVIDLWSLLQLPGGGVLYIPCRATPRFRDYFRPIPRALWRINGQILRLEITGRHQYKIGVPASLTTGRVVYVRRVGRRVVVVTRDFWSQPWRRYCDVPLRALRSEGDAVQVYCDDGAYGGFGELEYHSPALAADRAGRELVDQSVTIVQVWPAQVWARRRDDWLAGSGRWLYRRPTRW
jgi:hypothetical protein